MIDESPEPTATYTTLWDWRRQVTELYTELRGMADAEAAWRLWRARRDQLFADIRRRRSTRRYAALPGARRLSLRPALPLRGRHGGAGGPSAGADADGADGKTVLLPFAGRAASHAISAANSCCTGSPATVAGYSCRSAMRPAASQHMPAAATCSTRSRGPISVAETARSFSTSTSPTIPPVPIPINGFARSPLRRTGCRGRSPPANGSAWWIPDRQR